MLRHCGDILKKKHDEIPLLTESERKILITNAHAYLALKCKKIEKRHIATVARLLVLVVPVLTDNSVGEHAGFVWFSCVFFKWFC